MSTNPSSLKVTSPRGDAQTAADVADGAAEAVRRAQAQASPNNIPPGGPAALAEVKRQREANARFRLPLGK